MIDEAVNFPYLLEHYGFSSHWLIVGQCEMKRESVPMPACKKSLTGCDQAGIEKVVMRRRIQFTTFYFLDSSSSSSSHSRGDEEKKGSTVHWFGIVRETVEP